MLMHGVGFCEKLCVSESADVSLDIQVVDTNRIRATMEISTVVSGECSQETFVEKGGVSGLTNVFIATSKTALAKFSEIHPDTFNNMFCGDIEKAEAIVANGLLLVLTDGDQLLAR